MSKPTYLRFNLGHLEDDEVTCLFCTLPRCDQSFTVAGGGTLRLIGVHNSCADKHMEKVKAPKKSDG